MRDIDVRKSLLDRLACHFASDSTTSIVPELGICQGEARIDVAVVNGHLHGFEIKSDSDTLARLPRQVELYGTTFDFVTLVVGSRHAPEVGDLVPVWWGIVEAIDHPDGVALIDRRPPRPNPGRSGREVARLLWREEALALLADHGLDAGIRSKPKKVLYERIGDSLPLDTVSSFVRLTLKSRDGWRPDARPV